MTQPVSIAYVPERSRNGKATNNPFDRPQENAQTPTQDEDISPGSPRWWLVRLAKRLMDRQPRFDTLENYVLGDHPNPNGDQRYVKALKEIQRKARTNYCELIVKATIQRMKVKAFRFGPVGEVDEEASQIWMYNDMDYQSPISLLTAASLGVTYGMVSPPVEPGGQPIITIEDPRCCIIERDPIRPTQTLASLRMWVDDLFQRVIAVLVVGGQVYTYFCNGVVGFAGLESQEAFLTDRRISVSQAGSWELISVEANPLGNVNPVVEGQWQPTNGDLSRAEHEVILDIQDRVNQIVLDQLVISKSQAYQQRWGTGIKLPKGPKGQKAPPWEPGADMLWTTADPTAKFGEFSTADISQILEAVKDAVGDMAAITQTPSSYLTNRIVNVSGDALAYDQTALVSKVKTRMEAMGWFYERLMKLAFLYKGDQQHYSEVEAQTLWKDPEVHSFAELGDFVSKMTAAEIPLELLMERCDFSPDEIAWAIKERDRQRQEAQAKAQATMEAQHANAMAQIKAGGNRDSAGSQSAKSKSTSGSKRMSTSSSGSNKPSSGSGSKSSS